jgi:hypothetical protein
MPNANFIYRTPQVNSEFLRQAWRHYSELEAMAAPGLRPGLARARTALLAGIPAWRLPAVLNMLAEKAGE